MVVVKKPVSEDDHQALVVRWAESAQRGKWKCLQWLLHIPNERKCTPAQGARLKRMGVRSGVSDLFLPAPIGGYHGLWIEMKAPGGRATENQLRFIADMRDAGYAAAVCVGYEAAIQAIKKYLEGSWSND